MSFRILSWNINGLRSFKTDMKKLLSGLEADIVCFQETKVTRDMLEEPQAIVDGYSSYFNFSRKRSGYSGVATYCSQHATPSAAQEGLSGMYGGELHDRVGTMEALLTAWSEDELKDLDSEGRAVITQHTFKGKDGTNLEVAVINVYCPRVDPEKPERRIFKLRFYELLRQRAAAIYATGCHVIILGDINTSHKRIDHCDPDETEIFEDRLERRYLDKFLIPLCKKEIDRSVEKGFCKEYEMNSFPSGTSSKDRISPQSQEASQIPSLSSMSEKTGTDVHQDLVSYNSDEGHMMYEDVDAQITLVREDLEKNDPHRMPEGKARHTDIEAEEFSDDHLLVSGTDFRVVDTFRYFYPDRKEAFSCWNTFTNARSTNYGTRIDYLLCNEEFLPYVEDSLILQDVMGSDHCPVAIVITGELVSSVKFPCMCTKFFPEFRGQQQKLSSYFQPISSSPECQTKTNKNSFPLSKTGSLIGKTLLSTAKRKTSNTQTKSANKKVHVEKQMKLSSFFVSKVSNQKNQTVSSNLEGNRCLDQNLSETEDSQSAATHVNDSSHIISESYEGSGSCPLNISSNCFSTVAEDIKTCPESGSKSSNQAKKSGWGFLMKGPQPPPLCSGHKEPTVLLTVKKKGPNINRQFYACARGVGKEGDPNARCNFFKWVGR